MTEALTVRPALVRRGLWLNYLTLGYNTVEAIVSIAAGLVAGSVALIGFGVDSGIEVAASIAAQWRLRADIDPERRERVEGMTHRVIGGLFLALAAYVAVESATTLWEREAPDASTMGLVILVLSVLVMPVLARAKRRSWAGGGPIRWRRWSWYRSSLERALKACGASVRADCPGAIGIPIIIRPLRHHPLAQAARRQPRPRSPV
jgi:Co/Zn/Cd efflux system component